MLYPLLLIAHLIRRTKTARRDFLKLLLIRPHNRQRNPRRRRFRIPIGTGTDRREGDGAHTPLKRELKRTAIGAFEQGGFIVRATAPHGADGVDDILRGQLETRRDLGVANLAAVELAAGLEQFGTGGAVDGAVDTAAAEQGFVGGVDDGVDVEGGDVGLDDFDHGLGVRACCVIAVGAPLQQVSSFL